MFPSIKSNDTIQYPTHIAIKNDDVYLNMLNQLYQKEKEDFLKAEIGPRTHNLWIAIPVTTLYSIILIAGVLGNILVCIVIVRNTSMHTATNYYLFNLAISDLIYLLFGLPFEVILFWHQYPYLFGSTFCWLSRLIKDTCTFVSVLTIVAFSIERFLAICYPLHVYVMCGFKRAVRIIIVIWAISIVCAIPFGLYTDVHYLRFPKEYGPELKESALCRMTESPPIPVWELSAILFYVLPLIFLLVFYTRIVVEIQNKLKDNNVLGVRHGSNSSHMKRTRSRRAVIRMLVVVVITFFICWSPFHIQHVLSPYLIRVVDFETAIILNTVLFMTSGIFYYTSCTINPIIYNVMSKRYRTAFRETLCGKRKQKFLPTAIRFTCTGQRSIRQNMDTSDGDVNHSLQTKSKRRSSSVYSKMTILNESNTGTNCRVENPNVGREGANN